MEYNRYKFQSFLLFTASLLFIILMAVAFWNVTIKSDIVIGLWPLVFLSLSVLSISLFFLVYKKATNSKLIEEEINNQLTQARAKIIEEFSKEQETEEDVDHEQEIEAIIENILPKGNFKSADSYIKKLFANLANEFQMVLGIYYSLNKRKKVFSMQSAYALQSDRTVPDFKPGENLNGQAADNKDIMIIPDVPEDYFLVESGLGKGKPKHLVIVPFVQNNETVAVLEFATFMEMPANGSQILTEVARLVQEKLNQL